jgi:hypothetical protein
VDAVGACPTRDAVLEALQPVLVPAGARGTAPPRVSDLGDRFEVTAAGQVAQYADAGRDCVERARVAAVFIALALNPPAALAGPAEPKPPTIVSPPPPPLRVEPVVPPPRWFGLELGARLDGALAGVSGSSVVFGVEVRGAIGRGAFGATVGAAALSSTVNNYESPNTSQVIPVREQRFPLSAGVMARLRLPASLEGSADVGLAVVLLTLRGEELAIVQDATRLDVGARAGVGVRMRREEGGLAPFLRLHFEFFPRPYSLEVAPLGMIGTTRRFWLGATAGVAFHTL